MSLIQKGPNNFQQKHVNDFVWTHLFGPLSAVLVQSPNPILIALLKNIEICTLAPSTNTLQFCWQAPWVIVRPGDIHHICPYWYTSVLFRPVKVRIFVEENKQDWPKRPKFQIDCEKAMFLTQKGTCDKYDLKHLLWWGHLTPGSVVPLAMLFA